MQKDKNFIIIIGGNRCGTTSLFHYLGEHPQIIPTLEKETRFFLDSDYDIGRRSAYSFDGKMKTYLRFFPKTPITEQPVWYLDSSPDFLYSTGTPERMKLFFEGYSLTLVALLRDPVDRFISWFHYDKQLGNVPNKMSLKDYLEKNITLDEEKKISRLKTGCYSHYLKRYRELFGDAIQIYHFNQLKMAPNQLMQDIFEKTGMTKTYTIDNALSHNASNRIKSEALNQIYMFLRQRCQNLFPTQGRLYNLLKRASKKYQRINYKPKTKGRLNKQVLHKLLAYYNEEYRFIEAITNNSNSSYH